MFEINKKNLFILLLILFFTCSLFIVFIKVGNVKVASASLSGMLEGAGKAAKYNVNLDSFALPLLVGRVIRIFLSLLGVIFLGLIVYSGYNWMTARGNEQTVEKSKDSMQNATIGLIIIISSYAITYFVLEALKNYYTVGGF